jgi:hypothetical protein
MFLDVKYRRGDRYIPQSAIVLRTTLMSEVSLRMYYYMVKVAYRLLKRKDARAILGL